MIYVPFILSLLASLTTALPSKELTNQVSSVHFWVVETESGLGHERQDEMTISQIIHDDEQFSQLNDLLKSTKGINDDLGNSELKWTLFAPTNEAFQMFNDTSSYSKKELMSYHITGDSVVKIQDLKDGQIFASQLKGAELKKERQIVRIMKRNNEVYVNWMAHLVTEIEASNGNILIIDRVLMPPQNLMETVIRMPQVFSTLAAAIFRTSLEKELKDSKAITVFAPDNRAWEEGLEFEDLFYLFSQEGKDDLKKMLKYHVVPSLEYSPRFREEGQVTLKTLNGKHEIAIQATQGGQACQPGHFHGKHPRCNPGQVCSGQKEADFTSYLLSLVGVFDGNDGNIDNPEGWKYDLNEGMAEIKFADAPAENGVVHVINKVLIPENVNLPSKEF